MKLNISFKPSQGFIEEIEQNSPNLIANRKKLVEMEYDLARTYKGQSYDQCAINSVIVIYAESARARTCIDSFNPRTRIFSSYFDHTSSPSTKVLLDSCLPLAVTSVVEPEMLIWENQHMAIGWNWISLLGLFLILLSFGLTVFTKIFLEKLENISSHLIAGIFAFLVWTLLSCINISKSSCVSLHHKA